MLRLLGPVTYERAQFLRKNGYLPDLKVPTRFNEKIAVRKLYSNLPNATLFSDKVAVRDYVARTVGQQYLKTSYLITNDPGAIDFQDLPEAFAIRANHGSGMNLIVADKSQLDVAVARQKLTGYLRQRYGRLTNERWYEPIVPQLLVEPFLSDDHLGVAPEYKIYVFHGRAQFMRVADMPPHACSEFFDRNWKMQDFCIAHYPACRLTEPPLLLGELREVAEALAGDMDFVRVDLYCQNETRIVFGELTLAPTAGWARISPRSGDAKLGSFW